MLTRELVVIVDDDPSVREALPPWLRQYGYPSRAFDSAEACLASQVLDHAGCLLLDIALPGMSGLQLHREVVGRGLRLPVIFLTGQADESVRHAALEQGAGAVLLKPFSDEALLTALTTALDAR